MVAQGYPTNKQEKAAAGKALSELQSKRKLAMVEAKKMVQYARVFDTACRHVAYHLSTSKGMPEESEYGPPLQVVERELNNCCNLLAGTP